MSQPDFGWVLDAAVKILTNVARIKLYDPIHKLDRNKDRKVLHTTITDNNKVAVAIFGCGSTGYSPYLTVFMEAAYNRVTKNLNIVIWDKGDHPLEVSVDGNLRARTDQIDPNVPYDDEELTVRKKYVSFNFRTVK